jgi:hypothetical protein
MNRPLPVALGSVLLALSLAACAAAPQQGQPQPTADDPAVIRAGACDAKTLSWALGQLADDALIERARSEAGAQTVRMLRPGVMITREFNATRLNIRVDNDRKVLATSCG